MSFLQEIRDIPSSKADLRKFGATLGIFFALVSVFLFFKQKDFRVLLFISLFFLFFALAWPAFLKPFQKMWMTLALAMGWVMSRVLLIVVFYGILTPIGFFLKIKGKDLLRQNWDKKEASYWLPHAAKDKASCEKQY